jgi:hypothetical protein
MEMGHERHPRNRPPGGLVERGEMVEMKNIRTLGCSVSQHPLPSRSQMLSELRAHSGKHPIRNPRPLLIGRMHRPRLGKRIPTRLECLEGWPVIDRANIESGKEGLGMPAVAGLTKRPTQNPYRPLRARKSSS